MIENQNGVAYSRYGHQKFSINHLSQSMMAHLALLRPSHWVKSLIAVPIGPVLMSEHTTLSTLLTLAATIAMFVLASAAVYVVNDMSDIERDRRHPTKCKRPLASGAVKPKSALWMLAGLIVAMALLSLTLPALVTMIVALYCASNLAYSFRLKHVPITELIVVAAGFALRTIAGYIAFNAVPDQWVVATVFTGSLLLVVGKRKDELSCANNPGEHRPVLAFYTDYLINAYLLIFAILCFGTGLISMKYFFDAKGVPALFLISLPFLVYLLLRYLQVVFTGNESGNPTKMILKDHVIHLVLFFWAAAVGWGVIFDQVTTFDSLIAYQYASEV